MATGGGVKLHTGDSISAAEYQKLSKQSPLQRELKAQLERAGFAFEEEFRFIPERKWKADFYLRHYRILLECDGGLWSKGNSGHSSGTGIINGYDRCNEAQIAGYKMLRFDGNAIKNGEAMKVILRACQIGEGKEWRGSR